MFVRVCGAYSKHTRRKRVVARFGRDKVDQCWYKTLLASTHLDAVTQSECFGLALKLQAALPTSLGTQDFLTVNVTQSLPGNSVVCICVTFIVYSI